jgi:4'-phosphopantetheinyl transferase
MVDIWYFDINDFDVNFYADGIGSIPLFMGLEIESYKYLSSRIPRLLARLIIRKALLEDGKVGLIDKFSRDKNNKPFIAGWQHFSITHSNGLVAVAFHSRSLIGIDTEFVRAIKIDEMSIALCNEEIDFLKRSINPIVSFFEIWTKKEAVVKATGDGIFNIKELNCASEVIQFRDAFWHLTEVFMIPNYISFVACSTIEPVKLKRLDMNDLLIL